MPCSGFTKTGKACGRKIPPGATMCEHHYREQENAKAYAEHCTTKCSRMWSARTPCPNKRHGENVLCKKCIAADEADRKERERCAAILEEQAKEDQALRDFPHWDALERFIAREIDAREGW